MGKRRRERDRPKSGPEALYNPNKRVMLSYGDDEDVGLQDSDQAADSHFVEVPRFSIGGVLEANVDSVEPQSEVSVPDFIPANYQIAEYPDDDGMSSDNGTPPTYSEFGSDDDNDIDYDEDDAEEEEDNDDDDGGDRVGNGRTSYRRIRRDRDTGQFPALGLLPAQSDLAVEDEGNQDIDQDALAYLESVRSERQAIPRLLTTAVVKGDDEGNVVDAEDGYEYRLYDGYAARVLVPKPRPKQTVIVNAQEAYTQALITRFTEQRKQMHTKPGEKALAALKDDHLYRFSRNVQRASEEQKYLLKTSLPMPAQIRMLKIEPTLRLLELALEICMSPKDGVEPQVSAWIWALLARLPSAKEMTDDAKARLRRFAEGSIAVLSEFAKGRTAVHEGVQARVDFEPNSRELQLDLAEDVGPNAFGLYTSPHSGEQETDTSADVLEATCDEQHAGALSSKKPSEGCRNVDVRLNTAATLDMIVVIVGDVFNEEELLNHRIAWPEILNSGEPAESP